MVDIRFRYKVALSCIVIMMVFVTLSGFSYAYFVAEITGESKPLTITTEGVKLTFTGEENVINLTNEKPTPDSDALKNDPYTFTLTNNNSYAVSIKIYLTVTRSDLPATAIKYAYTTNGTLPTEGTILSTKTKETTLESGKDSYLLDDTAFDLAAGAEMKDFKLVLWIDENVGGIVDCSGEGNTATCEASETMSKTFEAHISIRAEQNREAQTQSSGEPVASSTNQNAESEPEIFDSPQEVQDIQSESNNIPNVIGLETINPGQNNTQENIPNGEQEINENDIQNEEGIGDPSIG